VSDIPHLGYIVAAYAVAACAIAVMIAAILVDYRDLTARLAKLETRRDDTPSPPR
jgi:heme exporter protein CcmD